ncbi:hypothetical protein C8J57DRAFT_740559 [Mycena rebaudengoi]|nr:hypothetical protein C8J57DRAFT_740559 [Mycena rebaudengoi]
MTVRFANYRIVFYVAVFLLCGTILGLGAHFASIFLPHLHPDFSIFTLVVPSLTIFIFLLSLQFAQPRTEALSLFVLWALWLSMAAWSTYAQCYNLVLLADVVAAAISSATSNAMHSRQKRCQRKSGEIREREYCYEMKVIQAFSWMLFVLVFLRIYYTDYPRSIKRNGLGDPMCGRVPIQELGWFSEMPGYYNQGMVQYPGMYPQQQYGYPMQMQAAGYAQQPNQQVYQINQGPNGPTVSQVPVTHI